MRRGVLSSSVFHPITRWRDGSAAARLAHVPVGGNAGRRWARGRGGHRALGRRGSPREPSPPAPRRRRLWYRRQAASRAARCFAHRACRGRASALRLPYSGAHLLEVRLPGAASRATTRSISCIGSASLSRTRRCTSSRSSGPRPAARSPAGRSATDSAASRSSGSRSSASCPSPSRCPTSICSGRARSA